MRVVPEVTQECGSLLATAAVIGPEFDLDVLAAAVGREPLECLDVLVEAQRLGVVASTDGPDRGRFVDAGVHAAVLDGVSAGARVRLHVQVAEAIWQRYADRIDAHLLELAGHWSAAAVGDYRVPAAGWVARAAEAAIGKACYPEAARLFQRALDIGRDAIDAEEQCRLLLGLAVASYRCSDVAAALTACAEASQLAADVGRPDLQAEAALVVEPTIVPDVNLRLRQLCEAALEALPPSSLLAVRVTARLADVCHYLGDFAAGRAACAELEQMGGIDPTALHARQLDASGPAGLVLREQLATQLASLARELADPTEAAWAHLWLVDAALQRGDLARARREVESVVRVGADMSDVMVRWQLLRAQAALAQAQARYDDAGRLADDAAALLTAAGNPLGRLIWAGQQACIRYHTGIDTDFAARLGLLDDDSAPVVLVGTMQVLTDVVLLLGIDLKQRAAALYRSLGPAVQWQFQPHSELFVLSWGLLAAVGLDERGDVAMLADRLAAHRGQHVAAGAGCVAYFGPVEFWLGIAAAYLGSHEQALADLGHALAVCGANGAAGFRAQAQLELALVHAQAGGASEMRRARSLAGEALHRAELLGMAPLAVAASRLLGRRAAGEAALTKRETQVAELVAEGLSNRTIAQRLYLSERTVGNHVQHIFDKLGLDNRSQIVAWVQQRNE